jgi:hypothetical protein
MTLFPGYSRFPVKYCIRIGSICFLDSGGRMTNTGLVVPP